MNFNDTRTFVKPPLTDSTPINPSKEIKFIQNNFADLSISQKAPIISQPHNPSLKLPKDSKEFLLDADSDSEDTSSEM